MIARKAVAGSGTTLDVVVVGSEFCDIIPEFFFQLYDSNIQYIPKVSWPLHLLTLVHANNFRNIST